MACPFGRYYISAPSLVFQLGPLTREEQVLGQIFDVCVRACLIWAWHPCQPNMLDRCNTSVPSKPFRPQCSTVQFSTRGSFVAPVGEVERVRGLRCSVGQGAVWSGTVRCAVRFGA